MNLKEYLNNVKLTNALPQGDTVIDISTTEIIETKVKTKEGTERPAMEAHTKDGNVYFLPKNVLSQMQNLARAGATNVRITRTGTTLQDTRYTVVRI
jgi:hypothetical protein